LPPTPLNSGQAFGGKKNDSYFYSIITPNISVFTKNLTTSRPMPYIHCCQ